MQRASVARMTPYRRFNVNSDFVILGFFFFFGFQPKATRAGDGKHGKKSTWPKQHLGEDETWTMESHALGGTCGDESGMMR